MSRSERGSALPILLAVLAALTASAAVAAGRLARDVEARRDNEARTQSLWLARSAAARGRPGTVRLVVGEKPAEVTTATSGRSVRVVAKLASGTAEVAVERGAEGQALAWQERYARTP